MNDQQTKWPRWTLVTMLAAMSLLTLCGCESEETSSDITPTRFYVYRELVSYSEVDNFYWDTTLNQALATIRIKDFTHGDATMRVFDSRGKLLLTKFLFTPDNTFYVGGKDFLVTELTDIGASGQWRVELGYSQFTGDISITME